MAKEAVDTRKLKDQVADYLKKAKWEKASEILEQLVRAEPRDMSHRLRLGDAYRRQNELQKSIEAYQAAARTLADQGQLIKAIGAVKVILEIEPQNAAAQKQLSEMNGLRFSKPTLESAGLLPRPRPAPAAPAIDLDEDAAVAPELAGDMHEMPPSDDEPLELDDGKPSRRPPAAKPAIPQRGFQTPMSKPAITAPIKVRPRSAFDIGAEDLETAIPAAPPPGAPAAPGTAKPPPRGRDRDLDELELEGGDVEALPDDAILTPSAEDLAVHGSEEVLPFDEDFGQPTPASGSAAARRGGAAGPAGARAQRGAGLAAPASRSAPPAARAKVPVAEEISLDEPAPARRPRLPPGAAQPIADLLSSESEEEIELLSISSDEEIADRPIDSADPAGEAEIDTAFGNLSPAAQGRRRPPPMKVPLFDDLSQDAFVELVNRVSYHRHVPRQLIIREGDPGRSFFVIVEGKVRIYKALEDGKELTLARLEAGAFFGEMALLSGAPRTANVVAEEETELLEVTDVVLRELAEHHPPVVQSLKKFYRQRLLNNVMAISPLFRDFTPAERKSIVEKFKMRQVPPGDVLIDEGKNSDGLYVVLHGSVNVSTRRDGRPVELARLKEGDIFGEMSLLTRKPATATVAALGNSIVLKLKRENFQELVLTHPQILELVSELTERRRSATDAILSGQGPGHDGMSFV